MASRTFSVIRRVPTLVDMLTPLQAGVDGYRIKASSNFDGTFTTLFTANRNGWMDSTVNRDVLHTVPNRGIARMVWNPANYSGAGITDTGQIWVQLETYIGAVLQATSPISLILPVYDRIGKPQITIAGLAPTAATSALALQLDLPMGFRNVQIFNQGSNPLMISTVPGGGPEVTLAANSAGDYTLFGGCQDTLRIRGNTQFAATLVVPFIE